MKKPACDLCHDDKGIPEVLFLHARCHMTAPLQVSMEGDVLIIRCYIPECSREVGRFKVVEQVQKK